MNEEYYYDYEDFEIWKESVKPYIRDIKKLIRIIQKIKIEDEEDRKSVEEIEKIYKNEEE